MNHLTPHIDAFGEEAVLVGESARAFFASSDIKSIRERLGRIPSYRPPVWRQMVEMGWAGWRADAAAQGSALSFEAGLLLHEELGAAAAPEPLLQTAVLAAGVLGRSPSPAYAVEALGRLARGETAYALAWQPAARGAAPGPRGARARRQGDAMALDGALGYIPLADAEYFLVCARCEEGLGIYRVRRDAPGLAVATVERIDGVVCAQLALEGVRVADADTVIPPAQGEAALEAVLDEGRLALSAELLGAMAEVLDITLEYLRTRKQFGRALSSFQALQHRAADLAGQVETTRSVVQASARVFDQTADPIRRRIAASRAKARASAGAIEVINACVQLHGGIAYTEECDIGVYLKRAMALAAWLGDARANRDRAAELAERGGDDGARAELPAWLEEIRAWVEDNLPPAYRYPARRMSWREAHGWHRKLHERGWVAPAWPREFGGMGLTPYEELQLHEVYETFGLNTFQNMGLTMLGPLLQRYGTPAQQQEYLPRILSGETYWCQGYSEPEAGSDLAALRTSAVREGDEFMVNGQKIWTSLAHEADMMFLLARTDPAAKKQQGISFLLVDMKTPGITVNPIVNLTGAKDFCSVFFDNVRVPAKNLVGEPNQGWTMAKSVLGSERIMIGHPRFAKSALQALRQIGANRGLSEEPVFRHLYRGLAAEVADLEALYVRYLDALRNGRQLGAEVSLLKIRSSETWQRIVEALRETAGEQGALDAQEAVGEGLSVHAAVQFLHARPATIYGGSNEIQRNILAAHLLKLS
ncbi:acyl-CoA dehydrogenase family protein [Achromobacter denitrificans]|uniref:acyl-CoA dehydrogenase n=1 Tax=Achromobacter denitrificans TaxID=32002 RepID=UPI0023E86A6E|nr:acyl-CoA dehydrogenase family protein [Achromobacter denitrificans]MDF3943973.1 acyl-CoA dehydrogenase family protein [Achromobacter denitrificans]